MIYIYPPLSGNLLGTGLGFDFPQNMFPVFLKFFIVIFSPILFLYFFIYFSLM